MKKRRSSSGSNLEITSLSAISHVLENRPDRIQRLVLYESGQTNARVSKLRELARQKNVRVDIGLPKKGTELAKAWLSPYEYTEIESVLEKESQKKHSFILALDHIQDPQNFGAICRTSEAFGIAAVMIPKDRAVVVSSGVYHASVGAVETLPIVRTPNLGTTLRKAKEAGYWIVGAAVGEKTKSLIDMPDFEKVVVVLGSEWGGLGRRMEEQCDCLVQIPLAGRVESLNVGAAGALFIYEVWRRRQGPSN